ncbi:hypothetical protein OUZ56_020348 [Daphnia magna]|uniref:Uncharacterized protein n=1 Tax=Daphnia magna TaxID=35525 RepID=A0ABQ9ZE85_9CRUS|nr:hypothetical protein OUZ56_020348 [Daphnia magna]
MDIVDVCRDARQLWTNRTSRFRGNGTYFTVGFQLYHVYSIGSANSTLVEIIGVTADSDIAPAPGSAISSNRSII